MESNVRISVIIPVYNGETFLGRCIRSLIKQRIDNEFYEIIFIDDGSTDHTQQILENYNDYIKVIRHKKNKGLAISCNEGIKKALGSYIIRVDADDYIDENFLTVLSSVLDDKPEIGLVFPDYYHVDSQGDIIETIRREKITHEEELLDLPAHGACTMYRKEVLQNLGSYFLKLHLW